MKRVFPYLVLAASFTLAASAAYYSVFGLSKLFSSQSLAIIILAGSLESAKLITASYLHRYWTKISMFIKTYMMIAVLVLMSITSLGIYGFLVSAYQDTAYKLENLDSVTDAMTTKKSRFESQVLKLNHESESVNKNIDNLTGALANNVIRYTDAKGNQVVRTSNENRKAYETQLQLAAARLETLNAQESILNDSITAIDMRILDLKTNSKVASEIGPLKYIAKMTGSSMDSVVNWLIILLIVVFDPLAIILLISANKAFDLNLTPTHVEIKVETPPIEKTVINNKPIEADIKPKTKVPDILSYWHTKKNK
jgi:hypothetical protein